jgi:mono/diheme cytochrome c family protein
MHLCNKCHPGGTAGVGPSINDKPLPEIAIRTQIREGVGAMPKFSDTDLDDHDLDAVVAYVEALRDAPAHR